MFSNSAHSHISKSEFVALAACSVALYTGILLANRIAPSVVLEPPGSNGWIISRLALSAGFSLSGLTIVIARLVAVGRWRFGVASYVGWWLVASGVGLAWQVWADSFSALPLFLCLASVYFVALVRYRAG